MGLEWVSPAIAGLFLLAAATATALVSLRTNKRTSDSSHAPDVTEAWREADKARAQRHVMEDLYYLVRGAFKGYARRMQQHFGEYAALNEEERAALSATLPSLDGDKEKETA